MMRMRFRLFHAIMTRGVGAEGDSSFARRVDLATGKLANSKDQSTLF